MSFYHIKKSIKNIQNDTFIIGDLFDPSNHLLSSMANNVKFHSQLYLKHKSLHSELLATFKGSDGNLLNKSSVLKTYVSPTKLDIISVEESNKQISNHISFKTKSFNAIYGDLKYGAIKNNFNMVEYLSNISDNSFAYMKLNSLIEHTSYFSLMETLSYQYLIVVGSYCLLSSMTDYKLFVPSFLNSIDFFKSKIFFFSNVTGVLNSNLADSVTNTKSFQGFVDQDVIVGVLRPISHH